MVKRTIVSRRRHIAKTITWRVLATAVTFIVTWAITGKLAVGAAVGGFEATAKMLLYYFHERVWEQSDFGIYEVNNISQPVPEA